MDPLPTSYTDNDGRLHSPHLPIHLIPHYTIGRLIGFENIALILLFPHLVRENQQHA